MGSDNSVVIVGAGQAAGQLVASLAQDGFKGRVTIVGDEPHPPYQRPPLSKKFLAGELTLDRLYLKPQAFYDKAGVRLLLGRRIAGIDRKARVVVPECGAALAYSTLILATGSRPRPIDLPGANVPRVLYLRTIADVEEIRRRLGPGKRLAIVGGGYIGLELAAVAAKQGAEVTVLEQAPRVMGRGVGPVVSSFYERLHGEEGVKIRTGVAIQYFNEASGALEVVCSDARHAADLIVVGVGALPNVELAREAGLAVDGGIVVDAQCRTADPMVYAIGDCATQVRTPSGRGLRLESVHCALEQARVAAASICGKSAPAPQTPWFWSDQHDVKLQMAGLSTGHDEAIVRGDPETSRSFSVFYVSDGKLIAMDAINRAADFMISKQLIAEGARLDVAKVRDDGVAVRDARL